MQMPPGVQAPGLERHIEQVGLLGRSSAAIALQQLEVDPVECEMEDAAVGGGEGEDVDVARNCAKHFGVFNDLYGKGWTMEMG